MNPEDEKDFIRAALEDPRADLPPELVEDLSPEERTMYQQHRILDTNLRSGLKDLTAPLEAHAAAEDAFKARLLAGIKKEPAPAGLFFLRLRLKDIGEKLRELFWYEPGPVYRWTPALIILLILPIVPLMINEQSKQEVARHDSAAGSSERKTADADDAKSSGTLAQRTKSKQKSGAYTRADDGLKKSARAKPGILAFKGRKSNSSTAGPPANAGGKKLADAKTKSASPAKPAADLPEPAAVAARTGSARVKREAEKRGITRIARRSRRAASPTSGDRRDFAAKTKPAKKPVVADEVRKKKSATVRTKQSAGKADKKIREEKNDTREQELLDRLKKARTPEAKRKVLKELEQYYRAKSAVRKLREIREKLKTFK